MKLCYRVIVLSLIPLAFLALVQINIWMLKGGVMLIDAAP
jgi:hypothetical protein